MLHNAVGTAAVPTVTKAIVIGTAVVWAALETRQAVKRRSEAVKASWSAEVVFRLVVAAGAVGAIQLSRVATAAAINPEVVASWVGLVMIWTGVALRLWSFRTLGRYFTFVVQTSADQPVITDGPYRVIRHPSYAGLLLAVMGLGLFLGNWLSLLTLTVAMAGALVVRISVEERALTKSIGEDYRQYAATHKRLVPFVW